MRIINLERKRDLAQWFDYLGMLLILIGTIYSPIVLYIGMTITLLGTIGYNSFTKKIEKKEKVEKDKIEKERIKLEKQLQNEILKSQENTDKLLNLNAFMNDANAKINRFYLILDLGSTLVGDNFNDFVIYVRFEELDLLYEFRAIPGAIPDFPDEEKVLLIKSTLVKGKDINNNPLIFTGTHCFKNLSEMIFNLYFPTDIFPMDLTINKLQNTFYQLIVSSKHKNFIKEIKINANNWNIVNKVVNDANWKDFVEDWIDNEQPLSILYDKYETIYYDAHSIDPIRNGVHKYEIYHKLHEDLSKNIKFDKSILSELDESTGTLLIWIDNNWLLQDGRYLEYLPLFKKGKFKLHIFRDSDNKLKIEIGNSFVENITLEYLNDKLFSYEQKKHQVIITWNKSHFTLNINGKLVDEKK